MSHHIARVGCVRCQLGGDEGALCPACGRNRYRLETIAVHQPDH